MFVVEGMSVCRFHEYHAVMGASPLLAAEQARTQLRNWWKRAGELHGEWNMRKQQFSDGSTIGDWYWETWPQPAKGKR